MEPFLCMYSGRRQKRKINFIRIFDCCTLSSATFFLLCCASTNYSKNCSTTMENLEFSSSCSFQFMASSVGGKSARKAHKIDISSFSAFGSDLDDWKLISRMHIKTEKICKSLFSFFVISREIEKWWTENSFRRLFHPHSNISSRLLSSFFCEAEKCRCRARGISFHFIYSSCYHSHRKIYNILIS